MSEELFVTEGVTALPDPPSYLDNGFSSDAMMRAAHRIVALGLGSTTGRVLELGCADGALLEKVRQRPRIVRALGVEQDLGKVARGSERHPDVWLYHTFIEALDWTDSEWSSFDAVLFAPERLACMTSAHAERTRRALLTVTPRLVLYTYHLDLKEACREAGLPVPSRIIKGHGLHVEVGSVMRGA